jgi:hypothetical protein
MILPRESPRGEHYVGRWLAAAQYTLLALAGGKILGIVETGCCDWG